LNTTTEERQPNPCVVRTDWSDDDLDLADKSLEKLPEDQRAAVLAFAADQELDRRESLGLVQALCRLSAWEREQIGLLYRQAETRGYAIATVLYPPSSWAYHWKDARDASLGHVVSNVRACLEMLPEDPLAPQLQTLLQEAEEVLAAVRHRHDERVQQRYAGLSVSQALEQARADVRREGPGEPSLDG
jgi:hypothetical protein